MITCCNGPLFLRITLPALMLFSHGFGKIKNYGVLLEKFPDPIGLGSALSLNLVVFAEVFCAALVILGIATRLALIPLIVTMLTAFFVFHAADPFSVKELSFVFLLGFISIFLTGSGSCAAFKNIFPKTSNKFLNYLFESN